MTSTEMDAMLKSIRVECEGGRLQISGRAIVDGKSARFMVLRKITVEQNPNYLPVKMLWFDELNDFNMKGDMK